MLRHEIIDFKSLPEFFEDEKSDLKNNTARYINLEEEKFQVLLKMWKSKVYGKIRINKLSLVRCDSDKAINIFEDKMYSFIREIKHIAIYKNLMIITWSEVENGSED